MRSVALFLAAASTTDAFNAPRNQALHLTSLSAVSVDTHHRLAEQELGVWQTVSRDSPASNEVVNGEEKRASWTSYAPEHGTPMSYGAVGCPGVSTRVICTKHHQNVTYVVMFAALLVYLPRAEIGAMPRLEQPLPRHSRA